MNLFKKIVAGASIFAVAVVTVAPGVSAYTNAQLDAANTLAASGVIVDHSNDPMAYNMDQTVLRQEIAAVARGIYEVDNSMAVNSAKADTCTNAFADVSATNPNTWACYTVEGLRNASVIAANPTFRPEENITKSEALGMVVRATCNDYAFDASSTMTWQQQLGAYASAKGIASFSDYTTAATRGFTFEAGVNAMNACANTVDDSTDSLLEDLLSDLDNDDTTDTDTDDTVVNVVTGGVVEITLSPTTPAAATIPGGVSGLPVAVYDFTAGDSDVTISSITVKRRGLSDADTLTGLAAFSDSGRMSKEKNDSQENDTEAQLTLTDGFVIKAGETRTLTVVVDVESIANEPEIEADEFSIELVEVVASADVETDGTLNGNTMRIGSRDAAMITISKDSNVSDVVVGDEGVDVFTFQVEGASDEDVLLTVITFQAGDSDATENLENFVLEFNGDEVAMGTVSGKYVTFNLGAGVLIEEDKNEDFTVTADVIAGAGDTYSFFIDGELDVTGIGQKYGYGLSVDISGADSEGELGSVTIEAGELTLADVDAAIDKIRADKDNVELGTLKVTNVAGQSLELQQFGIKVELSNTTYTLGQVFDNFELYNEETGTSYELTTSAGGLLTGVYGDDSIDLTLAQGTTSFIVRADTLKDVPVNTEVTLSLSVDGSDATGEFYVEETEDDQTVDDITPSSLNWKKLTFIDSGATIANVPLANTTVVRGTEDEVAMQFEIEAEEASDISIDEIVALVQLSRGPGLSFANGTAGVTTNTYTITPVGPGVGDAFVVYKDATNAVASYAAGAATVADVTAGLTAALTTAGYSATNNGTTVSVTTNDALTVAAFDGPDATDTQGVSISSASATVYTSTITVSGQPSGTYGATVDANVVTPVAAGATNSATASALAVAINANAAITAVASVSGNVITLTAGSAADVLVSAAVTTGVATNSAATNQEISEIALYKGTVSGTPLDVKSGSDIASNGTVVFDGFNVDISADDTETFIITVNIVDGADAVANSPITTSIIGVSAEDDEGDDVAVLEGGTELSATNDLDSNKDVAVTNSGLLTLAADANNMDNKDPKTILGGESMVVYSADIQATNEEIDVETVTFTVTTDLRNAVKNASLYIGNTLVATNANSDITATTITFDNLTGLIVPESTEELRLELNTANIGYENVGVTISNAMVTQVVLSEAEGADSGKAVNNVTLTNTSKLFSIVPSIVIPSVVATFGNTAEVKFTVDSGDNSKLLTNSSPAVTITSLDFVDSGNSTVSYRVKDEDGVTVGTAVTSNGGSLTLVLTGAATTFTSTETYFIEAVVPSTTGNYTWGLKLDKDGINYTTDASGTTALTSSATSVTDMGSSSSN